MANVEIVFQYNKVLYTLEERAVEGLYVLEIVDPVSALSGVSRRYETNVDGVIGKSRKKQLRSSTCDKIMHDLELAKPASVKSSVLVWLDALRVCEKNTRRDIEAALERERAPWPSILKNLSLPIVHNAVVDFRCNVSVVAVDLEFDPGETSYVLVVLF